MAIRRFWVHLAVSFLYSKQNKKVTGALSAKSVFYQSTNYYTEFLNRENQSEINRDKSLCWINLFPLMWFTGHVLDISFLLEYLILTCDKLYKIPSASLTEIFFFLPPLRPVPCFSPWSPHYFSPSFRLSPLSCLSRKLHRHLEMYLAPWANERHTQHRRLPGVNMTLSVCNSMQRLNS